MCCVHNRRVTASALQPINSLDQLRQRGRVGRRLVALAALAVVRFVCAGATHKHLADEVDDCPVCAAVVHAVSDMVLPGTLPIARYVLLYAVARALAVLRRYAAAVIFPCICGPPSQTS